MLEHCGCSSLRSLVSAEPGNQQLRAERLPATLCSCALNGCPSPCPARRSTPEALRLRDSQATDIQKQVTGFCRKAGLRFEAFSSATARPPTSESRWGAVLVAAWLVPAVVNVGEQEAARLPIPEAGGVLGCFSLPAPSQLVQGA